MRRNLTIRLSYDEGKTWPVKKVLEPGPAGYSDLAVGPDGSIFCFFERGGFSGDPFQTHELCLSRCHARLADGRRDHGASSP